MLIQKPSIIYFKLSNKVTHCWKILFPHPQILLVMKYRKRISGFHHISNIPEGNYLLICLFRSKVSLMLPRLASNLRAQVIFPPQLPKQLGHRYAYHSWPAEGFHWIFWYSNYIYKLLYKKRKTHKKKLSSKSNLFHYTFSDRITELICYICQMT